MEAVHAYCTSNSNKNMFGFVLGLDGRTIVQSSNEKLSAVIESMKIEAKLIYFVIPLSVNFYSVKNYFTNKVV